MINTNQVDDDLNDLAKASLNQKQNVIAAGTGVATTLSSSNDATGTVANPGPSGFGGATRPGKRTYNPLSKLASYTYNLTLYMITPDAYEQFVQSGRQKIDALSKATTVDGGTTQELNSGAYIIAQSGGINNSTSKRAPGFELDFYIDNLKFTTLTNTKETQSSTAATATYEFTITEPYGFSFMTNLKKARKALQAYSESAGYESLTNDFKNFYILGIRFYGYDAEGNVVKPNTVLYGEPVDPLGTDALFENFYDMQITNIGFKLDGKAAVYNINATGLSGQTLLGTKRGRIPEGGTFSGRNVGEALGGPDGLFEKLNKQQRALVASGSKIYPNTYTVEFLGPARSILASASLVTPADVDKSRWDGSGAKNTTQSNDAAGGKPPNSDVKILSFNTDTAILSAIDAIIKQSEFMVNALKTVFKSKEQPDPKTKTPDTVVNQNPAKVMWYTASAEIASAKWDTKANDWAFETKYLIQLYEIPAIPSIYVANSSRYYGPHKRYEYWFTGKNSEVLDFSLQMDNMYINTVLAPVPGADATQDTVAGLKKDAPVGAQATKQTNTATQSGAVSIATGLNPGGDRTGGKGLTMSAQNSVVTYLTDTGAFSEMSMKILGDPDLLVRDTVTSINELYNQFYDTNGYTVSAQGGQVFIELAFKEAKDYNTNTGLMDINAELFFMDYPDYIKEMTGGALVMQLNQVDSVFASGKFEQTLHLINAPFADPNTDTSAAATQNTGPAPTPNPPPN